MTNRKRREMLVLRRDSLLSMMRDREQIALRALSEGRIEPAHRETIRALAAMALAEQGNFAGAQADLNGALDIAPYNPLALNGQAWFYAWYRHDNLAGAEQLAQRAIAGACVASAFPAPRPATKTRSGVRSPSA